MWDLRFYRAFKDWEIAASYSLLQFIQPRIPRGDRGILFVGGLKVMVSLTPDLITKQFGVL